MNEMRCWVAFLMCKQHFNTPPPLPTSPTPPGGDRYGQGLPKCLPAAYAGSAHHY